MLKYFVQYQLKNKQIYNFSCERKVQSSMYTRIRYFRYKLTVG